MRTTLAIDDDVLIAAKAIAKQQNRSLDEVLSDLARRALRRPLAWQPDRNHVSRNGPGRREHRLFAFRRGNSLKPIKYDKKQTPLHNCKRKQSGFLRFLGAFL
jgi:hypothetical protein